MAKESNTHCLLICGLLRTFFKVSPLAFLSALSMSLLSQVVLLLALLLPLKVIMLLSTSAVPDSFPEFLQPIPYDRMVVGLVLISLLFYIVGNGAQKITDLILTRQSRKLARAAPRLEIYDNQTQLEKTLYVRFFELIAGSIFLIAGVFALSILYIEVGLLLAMSVTVLLWRESAFLGKITDGKNDARRISYDIVFLSIFIYVVVDKLYFEAPGFIVCLVAIITARILVNKTFQSSSNLIFLIRSEDKLKVLFFGEKISDEMTAKPLKKTIWDAIKPAVLSPNLQGMLKELFGSNDFIYEAKWLSKPPLNTQILIISTERSHKKFVLKIYDPKIKKIARHELALLSADVVGLPVPELLKTMTIGESPCHLFDITGFDFVTDDELKVAASNISNKLLTELPSKKLISSYCRSKHLAWEQLNENLLENLRLIANADEAGLIDKIKSMLPYIRASLSQLPLFIDADINENALLKSNRGEILLLDWRGWELVPIGGSCKNIKCPSEHSRKVISLLPAINNFTPQEAQLLLSAEVSNFVNDIRQQHYGEALRVRLPKLQQAVLNAQATA